MTSRHKLRIKRRKDDYNDKAEGQTYKKTQRT